MTDDLKARVLANLPRGKANAITGKNLLDKLNQDCIVEHRAFVGNREMRLAIQDLIAGNHPICSSTKKPMGYFIATSREEVNENLKVLKYGYGHEIFKHYKYLAHARDLMFPQLKML